MFRRLVLKVVLCFTGCDTYFKLNFKNSISINLMSVAKCWNRKNWGCSVVLSSSLNIEFDISFERGSELCDDYLPLSHSSPSDEMLGSGSTKNVMIRETFCNTRTFSRHKSQCAHAILSWNFIHLTLPLKLILDLIPNSLLIKICSYFLMIWTGSVRYICNNVVSHIPL